MARESRSEFTANDWLAATPVQPSPRAHRQVTRPPEHAPHGTPWLFCSPDPLVSVTLSHQRSSHHARATSYAIDKAREALTHWTIRRAARLAKDIGCSYEPTPDAPSTFEEVQAAYVKARRERSPFPVWSGASDRTIYTSPEGNYAFRFIHDVYHAAFGHDFTKDGELAAARRHIDEVAQAFGPDSLEARLVYLDTAGQVAYFHETGGEFIADQLAWVKAAICVD